MRRHSLLLVLALVGCTTSTEQTESTDENPGKTEQRLDGRDGNAYVNFHRGRLLGAYAAARNQTAAQIWAAWSLKRRYLFLLHTDLLGNRTYFTNSQTKYTKLYDDGCTPQGADCTYGCQVMGDDQFCRSVSGYDCYHAQNGPQCYAEDVARTDHRMALQFVTGLYDVLGDGSGCGGTDDNRSFWKFDPVLIGCLRNEGTCTPEWIHSQDIGGPHAPFTKVRETATGRPAAADGPDGQVQLYSWDWEAQPFVRGGVWFPADPNMVEIDNDYNLPHDSSPLCWYGNKTGYKIGYELYKDHWQNKGNAVPVDLAWAPANVDPPACFQGQVSASPNGIFFYPGGNGQIAVSASCKWFANAPSWITLYESQGVSSGALDFRASSNFGASRLEPIDISGARVMVLQAGTQQLFDDVYLGSAHQPYIDIVKQKGITSGCSQTSYCPTIEIPRWQMAVFIVRALQLRLGQDANNVYAAPTPYFDDVPSNHVAFKYVQKLRELGITTGCGATTFCPDAPITEAQMATFVIRAIAGESFSYSNQPYFWDEPAYDVFFKYVQKMKELGISDGCGGGAYCPYQNVTRERMADYVIRGFFGAP